MGIRIHKVVGWGFQYCKYENDPRFNPAFWSEDFWEQDIKDRLYKRSFTFRSDEDDEWHAKWFRNWLDGNGLFEKPVEQLSVYNFVKYGNYSQEAGVGSIIFTLPQHKDWYRYDNIIDWLESRGAEDSCRLVLDEAGQPAQIYPYYGFVNRKTGQKVKVEQSDRWYLTPAYLKSPSKKLLKGIQELYGVKSFIEWQRDIVPRIPYDIRVFCEEMKVFKNPAMVHRLKPMIITYWD